MINYPVTRGILYNIFTQADKTILINIYKHNTPNKSIDIKYSAHDVFLE